MMNVFEKVYCAFCKLERGVCRKKHVTWTNVALAAFSSILIMYVVWETLEPKAVIIFAMCLMLAEVFVHLRWRLTLPCPHCHFDPILYQRNREKAVTTVKARLDELKASGDHLLRINNPFQNLTKISRDELNASQTTKALKAQKTENLLSRHV